MCRERGPQLLAQDMASSFEERGNARPDRLELLGRRQRIGRILRRPRCDFASQSRDAHHVELVEVGTEDGQKLEALQQRHPFVERFFKDTRVEIEPGQLSIEVRQGER